MKTNFQTWLKNYRIRQQVQMMMREIEQMKSAYQMEKQQ